MNWSPESPLKVFSRSRTLGPLGDLQGTSPGRLVPAGEIPQTWFLVCCFSFFCLLQTYHNICFQHIFLLQIILGVNHEPVFVVSLCFLHNTFYFFYALFFAFSRCLCCSVIFSGVLFYFAIMYLFVFICVYFFSVRWAYFILSTVSPFLPKVNSIIIYSSRNNCKVIKI